MVDFNCVSVISVELKLAPFTVASVKLALASVAPLKFTLLSSVFSSLVFVKSAPSKLQPAEAKSLFERIMFVRPFFAASNCERRKPLSAVFEKLAFVVSASTKLVPFRVALEKSTPVSVLFSSFVFVKSALSKLQPAVAKSLFERIMFVMPFFAASNCERLNPSAVFEKLAFVVSALVKSVSFNVAPSKLAFVRF